MINICEKGHFRIEDCVDYIDESCCSIQKIADFFRFGKQINQIKLLSLTDI